MLDLVQASLLSGEQDFQHFRSGLCGLQSSRNKIAFVHDCRDDRLEPLVNAGLPGRCQQDRKQMGSFLSSAIRDTLL